MVTFVVFSHFNITNHSFLVTPAAGVKVAQSLVPKKALWSRAAGGERSTASGVVDTSLSSSHHL